MKIITKFHFAFFHSLPHVHCVHSSRCYLTWYNQVHLDHWRMRNVELVFQSIFIQYLIFEHLSERNENWRRKKKDSYWIFYLFFFLILNLYKGRSIFGNGFATGACRLFLISQEIQIEREREGEKGRSQKIDG